MIKWDIRTVEFTEILAHYLQFQIPQRILTFNEYIYRQEELSI